MIRKSLSLIMILAMAAAPLLSRAATAAAAPSGGSVQLPAVENESPSSATPVVSPDQSSAAAMAAATPAPPSITFKSVNEAREKIRRAYLLRQYDAVLELSRAAAVQFPEEQAFEFYVRRAETMLKPTDDASEHSPAFRRLREKRRSESIQSIMKSVGQTTASAVAAAARAIEPEAEKPGPVTKPAGNAKPAGEARTAPVERAAAEEQAPPPPPPVRRSPMDKIKNLAGSPAVLYGAIGVIVLGIAGAVIARRKGGAKVKAETAESQPESPLSALEPEKQAAPKTSMDDMDSLFKPAAAAPPAEEPKTQIDNLDSLFASAAEPTVAAQSEASVQDSLDSFFKTEEPKTEVTASAPIKLEDSPIELPTMASAPAPVDSGPIMMPEFEPEPIASISLDSAPAEEIAPISIDLPDEDPFFAGSKPQAAPQAEPESKPEPEPEMAQTRIEFVDLPSFDEETKEEAPAADIDAMLRPIVPEIMEPPSGMQPEYAATRGFVDNPTVSSTAIEETSTAMDLPAIDVTPTVAVHEDETVALSEETKIDQSTAISPALPVDGASPENGSGGNDDLFSREYHKGMSDFVISNWAGAVHHLSIAAALRPAAVEVKEKLREARKRRKETEE